MGKRAKSTQRKHPYLRVFIFALLAAAVSIGIYVVVDQLGIGNWQQFDVNKIIGAQQSMHIYDKDDQYMALLSGEQKRESVPIAQVPQHVRNAFIAVEDVRFFKHSGVDYRRIVGSLWVNIKSRSLKQGASTISQQLIKLSHLTTKKTWARKLEEAYLATQMEKQYSKNEIMEMYLNFIYFGNGAYGIQSAAQSYFGKSVEDLTIAEGALLAGVINSPGRYAPHLNMEKSVERRNLVLTLMANNELITKEQADAAKAEQVVLNLSTRDIVTHGYFVDEVMLQAESQLGIPTEDLISGGYHIYTTVDQHMQAISEAAMADDALFPQNAADGTRVEGALIGLDPRSGEVRAMVGGRSYDTRRGLNRAVRLKRQPGSTIKPVLVYAPALQSGQYATTSFLLDEPTNFNGYTPQNFGGKYSGWVTLRTAVAKSLNVPAVQMLGQVGIQNAKAYATSVGIPFSENDNHLALALGGFESGLSPLEMAGSYQPFANGGFYRTPSMIRRIEDANGRVLFEQPPIAGTRVLSTENAFIMTNLLSSVVEEGTGKALQAAGVPLSAKSGTVDEPGVGNRDIWMVAFNSETIFSLWMGFDTPSKQHFISDEFTGGTLPAQLLARIYQGLYPEGNGPVFHPPASLKAINLDKKALERQRLELATQYTPTDSVQTEYFLSNAAPVQRSQYWQAPSSPSQVQVSVDSSGKNVISFIAQDSNTVYQIVRYSPFLPDTVIKEISGNQGERVIVQDYLESNASQYAIIPTRPDIVVNGETLTGTPVYAQNAATAAPSPSAVSPILPIWPSRTPLPQASSSPQASPSQTPQPYPSTTLTPTPTVSPAPSPTSTAHPSGELPLLPIN